MVPWKPTRAQILAAQGKTVADVIAFDLRVLFCGIKGSRPIHRFRRLHKDKTPLEQEPVSRLLLMLFVR